MSGDRVSSVMGAKKRIVVRQIHVCVLADPMQMVRLCGEKA